MAEPLSGNAGGVELPPGYLPQVYEACGPPAGWCISDEVQIGYGRTGSDFWGFELHGVVPDVITMAKAAGNGHPIGFVVTRREIAERFAAQGSFFSSVGGSPVSSRGRDRRCSTRSATRTCRATPPGSGAQPVGAAGRAGRDGTR